MSDKKEGRTLLKWKTSPFTKELAVPVGHKMVKMISDGNHDKTALINIDTGEELTTALYSYKKVDNQQFVKYFTENIAITHGLGLAGRKVCDILQWAIQDHAINKDTIWLGKVLVEEWNEKMAVVGVKKVSDSTFYEGITQLIKGGIVARKDSGRPGEYWLNANILFNGNRLAMISIIERDSNLIEGEVMPDLTADKQLDMEL